MTFSVCLPFLILCLTTAVIYVICSYARLMHILLNYFGFWIQQFPKNTDIRFSTDVFGQ